MTKHKPKFLTDLYFRKKVKQPGRHSRHAHHEPLGNDQASPVLVQQQVLHAEVPLDLPPATEKSDQGDTRWVC